MKIESAQHVRLARTGILIVAMLILTSGLSLSSDRLDTSVHADIPVLTEVYQHIHARRKDYTVLNGLYPGMSRYELGQYAAEYADQDANIYPNSYHPIWFNTPGKKLEVKGKLGNYSQHMKLYLSKTGQKPNDKETYVPYIEVVENFDPNEFDAESILKQITEQFGQPTVINEKRAWNQLIYKSAHILPEESRSICVNEIAASDRQEMYKHGAAMGALVHNIHEAKLTEAMQRCPKSVETFKKRVASDMGPVLDIRIQPNHHRVVYLLTYEAGEIFAMRNAKKYFEITPK